MHNSTDRFLTTHAGSLPRPPELRRLLTARFSGAAIDETALVEHPGRRRGEHPRSQAGLDVINNGEMGRESFFLRSAPHERLWRDQLPPDHDILNIQAPWNGAARRWGRLSG
jgi:hypothetical protein